MKIVQRLRTPVPVSDVLPLNEFSFTLGTQVTPFDAGPGEGRAVFTPAVHGSLYLKGGPGTGKTVLLRALAGAAAEDMDVHTIDMWGTLDKEDAIQPAAAASVGFTPEECSEMLGGVLAEAERRLERCRLEGTATTSELKCPPRRILIVMDDVRHLLMNDEFSDTVRASGAIKSRSRECIEKISATAARTGITFIFSSQWSLAETGIPPHLLGDTLSTLELTVSRCPEFVTPDRRESLRRGRYGQAGGAESSVLMAVR